MRTRAEALTHLQQDRFDVAVIGGGITGAGVALDAACVTCRTSTSAWCGRRSWSASSWFASRRTS
jgi:glycine/D-amino acid oxidase-like deaminating enzyme